MIPTRWAYLAVFVGVCGHASSEFFAVLSGISGPEVSVWRYTIGAAGLVAWALINPPSRDLWTPLRETWTRLVPLSLIGVSVTYLAFHWALDFASVIQVATVVTTIPIFVGLSNLIVNGASISVVKIITGVMAVLGIAILLTDGYLGALTGGENPLFGIFLAILCAALGSFFSVVAKPIIGVYGPVRVTALALSIGGLGLYVIVGLFFGVWVTTDRLFEMTPMAFWSLMALAILNTTITQVLWFGGLAAAADITRASYLFFLKPVIAAILAIVILNQPLTWLQALAILVVTGSVFVEILWPRLSARR